MSTNNQDRPMSTRREFTSAAVMALLSGYIIIVSEACGGSSNTTPTQPTTVTDVSGNISANHGHVATATAAAITAGTQVALNIQGTATHPHTLTLSGNDLTALKNRQTVTLTTTTDAGHQHTVTFTPA